MPRIDPTNQSLMFRSCSVRAEKRLKLAISDHRLFARSRLNLRTHFLILYAISCLLCLVFIGFILAPAVWIWGVIDGAVVRQVEP
jgi:hypothetical protein